MYTHPGTFAELASIAPTLGVTTVSDYQHTSMVCGCDTQCQHYISITTIKISIWLASRGCVPDHLRTHTIQRLIAHRRDALG